MFACVLTINPKYDTDPSLLSGPKKYLIIEAIQRAHAND
jgi:hypothetical protein